MTSNISDKMDLYEDLLVEHLVRGGPPPPPQPAAPPLPPPPRRRFRRRTCEVIFETMTDFDFLQTFRFSKPAVRHLAELLGNLMSANMLSHHILTSITDVELMPVGQGGCPLTTLDTVCLGLNMMAGAHFQRIGGIVGGLAQSAACRAINR